MTGDKIHVLLVEDNPGDVRLVKGMLELDENRAFALEHVSTLAEALSSLALGSGNQVILLDLGLPEASGLETLRRIMPLAQDASVVVITGLQDEEIGIAAIREGAHDYLIKGQVAAGQLRRILRYAVERNRTHRELRAEIERRTQVQQALQLSEQRYRLLSETAPMGILISDERGRIVDANAQALRMLGYERGEMIGEPVEMLLPERLRHSHQEHRSGYMKEPHARPMGVGMELSARRKDGTEFPVEIGLGPLVTREGVSVSSTLVDITERKKMEEHLRLSQRMEAIGKLSGGVAHDFNNVIGAILGWAELGCEEAQPGSTFHERFRKISDQANRAARLISQLLAFARRQVLQPRKINLNALVEEGMSLLRRLIGEHIEIRVRAAPDLRVTLADPTQIEQVLMNLCLNARDAMPDGGQLIIETQNVEIGEEYCRQHSYARPGSYVLLAVYDTGVGMDTATIEHIFEPFFTTKELGQGTGLGLATVYGIVKQHDGFIYVYSEPGKGTTFRIYLRADSGAPEPRESNGDGQTPRGTETILLAEDNDGLRESAREMLQGLGYRVILASNGIEAVQLFKTSSDQIDLVFLDVVMPLLNGPDAYSQITALRPGTKALFASGYTPEAVSLHSSLVEDAALLQKPYSLKSLGQMVRTALDRGRSARCPPENERDVLPSVASGNSLHGRGPIGHG